MGFIANAICLTYIDKVGRKLPLAWTSLALGVEMMLIMVFTKYFANTTNKIGQGWTIAWIFLFSFIFSLGYNAIQLLYIAEIFPTALRSRGTAICAFLGTGVGLIFNQLSPRAFEAIGWRYYAVFMVCNVISSITYFLVFPETKGKTLEEITEIFGDKVAFNEHIGTLSPASDDTQETDKDGKSVKVDYSHAE
ncbi:hypothetical protein NQ176_g8148 [Zarea fungicola]|uniref:Uncharacterized protein n=1 Tax=Zarea fungicola TaxID=93591 RepID=A0ACC1MUK5_9HYPO|nr:hypothetical protein NQ176_g8148 [Lecanicillium fungicola]